MSLTVGCVRCSEDEGTSIGKSAVKGGPKKSWSEIEMEAGVE